MIYIAVFLVLVMIKGNHSRESIFGWHACTTEYFTTIGVIVVISGIFFVYYRSAILKIELKK